MEVVASISFRVPFGVIFVEDYDNRRPSPEWENHDQVVSATVEAIRVRVTHGQVGPTEIIVGIGEYAGTSDLLYRGALDLPWGNLVVTDANRENALVVGVEPGRREVRIHVDESPRPHKVEILIDEPQRFAVVIAE